MTSVLGSLRRAREWAYPQLTESAFLEKGVLTPEEFLRAGDELVFRCPTWEWSSSPKASKEKSYLPPNKQYLITRNVPCRNRVSSLETNLKMEREGFESGENGDEGDDWMVSTLLAEGEDDQGIGDGFDILDEDGEVVVAPGPDGGGGAETNSGGGGGTGAGAPFPPEDSGGGGDDDGTHGLLFLLLSTATVAYGLMTWNAFSQPSPSLESIPSASTSTSLSQTTGAIGASWLLSLVRGLAWPVLGSALNSAIGDNGTRATVLSLFAGAIKIGMVFTGFALGSILHKSSSLGNACALCTSILLGAVAFFVAGLRGWKHGVPPVAGDDGKKDQ
mmetsp:Transcript_2236/g.4904  ORF Transcript_2236/g.4904 Transcript_2236/m.4904 type:complete len:332 (-) Transcript_2236:115-1110(-)